LPARFFQALARRAATRKGAVLSGTGSGRSGARSLDPAPSGNGESGSRRKPGLFSESTRGSQASGQSCLRAAADAGHGGPNPRRSTPVFGPAASARAPGTFGDSELGTFHHPGGAKPKGASSGSRWQHRVKQRTLRWSKALRLRAPWKRSEAAVLAWRGSGAEEMRKQREGNGRGDAERLSRREKLRRVYAPFGKARGRGNSSRREPRAASWKCGEPHGR
jgi:hypothetical protein